MELTDEEPCKGKKRAKKRTTANKKTKTKPSPVLKLDEETLQLNSISANDSVTPDFLNETLSSPSFASTNASPTEDDNYFIHLVLSAVLNKKKMELLESEEIMGALMSKRAKK